MEFEYGTLNESSKCHSNVKLLNCATMLPLIEFERNTLGSELMKYKMIYHGNRNVRPMFIEKKINIDIREMHNIINIFEVFQT